MYLVIYIHISSIIFYQNTQTTGAKNKLYIQSVSTNNPTPSTKRNAVKEICSNMFSDEKNVLRQLSKERAKTNNSHNPGGLSGRKITYDINKIANELAGTDCNNPRKKYKIRPLNFLNFSIDYPNDEWKTIHFSGFVCFWHI